MNNLKQIAIALLNYESRYGFFPPAYVTDSQGRRMHSWRVLLLPYLEREDLYAQYGFDEPWNGPNNSKLASQMPGIYRCPSQTSEDGSGEQTSYVAVVGPSTVWPGGQGRRRSEIRDDPEDTILLLEIADSGIHWMEPRDLTLDEALGSEPGTCRVPRSPHRTIGGYFVRGLSTAGNLITIDGGLGFLERRPSREELSALLSVDGGEPITLSRVSGRTPADEPVWRRLDWSHCIGLPLYVISLLLLLCRPLPEKWRAKPRRRET